MQTLLSSFKALADSTRLRIVSLLLAGSFNVNELVGILEMGQSRISRHLKILLEAGLVRARREGSWVYYSLEDSLWEGEPGKREQTLQLFPGIDEKLRSALEVEREAINSCFQNRRQNSETFFRGVANHWDDQRDSVQGPPDHLGRLVEILEGADTVVDLGTGTGVLLSMLSPLSKRVIGIDASTEMLRVARENARNIGLENIELRLGALEHLPMPDGEADAMVANMVLHHVAHPPEALREIHRSLRPSGRVLIADFKAHDREEYRDKLGDLWLGFDEQEFERWLREADLEMEHLEAVPASADRPDVFLAVAMKLS